MSLSSLDLWCFLLLVELLKPRVHPRAGNPEATSIPRVDYSTSQRQLTSTHAEVTYLIKPPITTKPVVRTNWFVHDLASLHRLHQQNKLILSSSFTLFSSLTAVPTANSQTNNDHDDHSQQSRRLPRSLSQQGHKTHRMT